MHTGEVVTAVAFADKGQRLNSVEMMCAWRIATRSLVQFDVNAADGIHRGDKTEHVDHSVILNWHAKVFADGLHGGTRAGVGLVCFREEVSRVDALLAHAGN